MFSTFLAHNYNHGCKFLFHSSGPLDPFFWENSGTKRERERESSCLQKVIKEETNDMEDNQIQLRVIKPYPNYHWTILTSRFILIESL